jgi:hypothetical protein
MGHVASSKNGRDAGEPERTKAGSQFCSPFGAESPGHETVSRSTVGAGKIAALKKLTFGQDWFKNSLRIRRIWLHKHSL